MKFGVFNWEPKLVTVQKLKKFITKGRRLGDDTVL